MTNLVSGDYFWEGVEFSHDMLLESMLNEEVPNVATHFEIPIFIFQGANDIITPTAFAREYFDRIEAPLKEFVTLPDAGHLALFTASEYFRQELVARVHF